MNVLRNFLETIPPRVPVPVVLVRIVNFTALCAALCNFTADSNIPRLNLVLVTHAESPSFISVQLTAAFPLSLVPVRPRAMYVLPVAVLLGGRAVLPGPSKTICGNLVASSDHKGRPVENI